MPLRAMPGDLVAEPRSCPAPPARATGSSRPSTGPGARCRSRSTGRRRGASRGRARRRGPGAPPGRRPAAAGRPRRGTPPPGRVREGGAPTATRGAATCSPRRPPRTCPPTCASACARRPRSAGRSACRGGSAKGARPSGARSAGASSTTTTSPATPRSCGPPSPPLRGIRWEDDAADLAAWARGETGFPLVDAGCASWRGTAGSTTAPGWWSPRSW